MNAALLALLMAYPASSPECLSMAQAAHIVTVMRDANVPERVAMDYATAIVEYEYIARDIVDLTYSVYTIQTPEDNAVRWFKSCEGL